MIKNIIFDMGGVLVNYTPKEHLRALGFDDARIELLFELIFNSPAWQELDRGTYTFQEAIDIFSKDNPELKSDIALTLNGTFDNMLSVKEESSNFLKQLKAEGFKIYVLSNFSVEGYEYIKPRFDYLNYVDEKIISGYIKMIKPNRDIYEYMLKKLDIIPSESIFIDDLPTNIQTAEELGIKTVLFTGIEEAEKKVRSLINEK